MKVVPCTLQRKLSLVSTLRVAKSGIDKDVLGAAFGEPPIQQSENVYVSVLVCRDPGNKEAGELEPSYTFLEELSPPVLLPRLSHW